MSDLQIAPAREKSVLPALLIAILVLAAIAVAIFYFNPHRIADLRVVDVKTFAPHTEMKELSPDSKKSGMRVIHKESYTAENDLYVVAKVNFTDKLRLPIFLTEVEATVTFADGTQAQTHMVSAHDVKRLSTIFPEIAPLAVDPIEDDVEIDPGKTLEGTVVLPFPGRDAAAWASKRNATLTLDLRNQEPQTTRLP